MKTNAKPSMFTRRGAFGLLLAGVTLPATRALAMKDVFIRTKPHVNSPPIVLTTCSGQTFTALFDSDLLIRANGAARGGMRFDFGVDGQVDYEAEVGGLDFDATGLPIRAWVLLSAHRSGRDVAQDYLLGSIEPVPGATPSEDCLIYTTIGTDVHVEPVRWEVPGAWQVQRFSPRPSATR